MTAGFMLYAKLFCLFFCEEVESQGACGLLATITFKRGLKSTSAGTQVIMSMSSRFIQILFSNCIEVQITYITAFLQVETGPLRSKSKNSSTLWVVIIALYSHNITVNMPNREGNIHCSSIHHTLSQHFDSLDLGRSIILKKATTNQISRQKLIYKSNTDQVQQGAWRWKRYIFKVESFEV